MEKLFPPTPTSDQFEQIFIFILKSHCIIII